MPKIQTAAEIEAQLELDPTNGPSFDDDGDDDDADDSARIAAEATTAAELEAGRKGWVPKDQYKGDPAKWVDAKTFVERGERFNKNLQKEVETLKAQIAGFEGTKKAFAKFHEETIAKKNSEIAEAISALRVQRSAAIREGDDEGAVALEDRIELLKDQRAEIKKPVEQESTEVKVLPMTDPVLLEWIDDGNQWFKEDDRLRAFAIATGDQMVKDGETAKGRKFLDLVAAKMAEEFPRRFKKAHEPLPNGVEGDSGSGAGRVGKTARDLPAEDRKLMKQFISEGWTTEEKFLKSYFSTTR